MEDMEKYRTKIEAQMTDFHENLEELSALTRGLSPFCIFHCFSIAPRTAEKGHEALYISSFKFRFLNFDVYNRFIYLHFIPAVGTTVVVFFRRRAEREI